MKMIVINYHQLIIFFRYSPSPKLIATVFITFLFILQSTHCQQEYRACRDNLFTCGQTIQGYPFWGSNRPRNSGVEEFFLTCHNDTYTTISIDGQIYRVLESDESSRWMRLALDQLSNNFCNPLNVNISFVDSLFSYRPNYYVDLTLFYNSSNAVNSTGRNTFSCPFEGVNRRGYLIQRRAIPTINEECSISTIVPVHTQGVLEFRDNQTWGIRDLVNFGFDIEYRFDNSSCSVCTASGGVCWINTTSTADPPTCLCPNRILPYACTIPAKGLTLVLKSIIGIGAAALALICNCILYCCIRKFPIRSPWSWKMQTNMDRNVEDFIRLQSSHNPKRYTYSEIKKMTKSFKDKLGRGGYGSVYKGKLLDGRLAAVKILNASKGSGEEFMNEVASIGRTSHINVVSLLGFCYDGKRRALVYKYMSNGHLTSS